MVLTILERVRGGVLIRAPILIVCVQTLCGAVFEALEAAFLSYIAAGGFFFPILQNVGIILRTGTLFPVIGENDGIDAGNLLSPK